MLLTTTELRCLAIDRLLLRDAVNASMLWRLKLATVQRVTVTGCTLRFFASDKEKTVEYVQRPPGLGWVRVHAPVLRRAKPMLSTERSFHRFTTTK